MVFWMCWWVGAAAGTWLTIFDIMSNACVLTNCGLVFFTSNIFSGLTLFQRMVRPHRRTTARLTTNASSPSN